MNQEIRPYTVSELTRKIKRLLETDLRSIALTGELSNVRQHSSGHIYLTLKDEHAQIGAVIWRSRLPVLPVLPEDGMRVVITGRLTVYEARGLYQIEVYTLRLQGIGELQHMFEELKRKLSAEGLFDAEHKKPMPEYPLRIGIVTSPTGAALQDILNVIRRRSPAVQPVLLPVRVQGAGAAAEISRAVRMCNEWGGVDVIILARGGGSIEDLWAFNEEVVARAIFASGIPTVSAVGHEIDFTIADFVADLRAPTPSAAGEILVADRRVLLEKLRKSCYILNESTREMLDRHRDTIRHILRSHPFRRPLDFLRQVSQKIDDLDRVLVSTMNHRIQLLNASVMKVTSHLSALDPTLALKRGFSLVLRDDRPVTRARWLKKGERIRIRFFDGDVKSIVD